jgi:aryl-alcohol dehydrogenase-like predicted oxidoreductase
MDMERLILGTAQLGMPYGIANTTGKPDLATATAIVGAAWECGIRIFDVAQEYGVSEAVLGDVLRDLDLLTDARVVTKLHKDIDIEDARSVNAALEASFARLRVPTLFGVLIRGDAWQPETLARFISRSDRTRVVHVGASVYSPARARDALAAPGCDFVQFPASAVDARFFNAGIFTTANDARALIHIRSIFLQGALLMDPDRIPERVEHLRSLVRQFRALATSLDMTPHALAIQFVKHAYPCASVLIGVETSDQVRANCDAWVHDMPNGALADIRALFHDVDERVLDMRLWNK